MLSLSKILLCFMFHLGSFEILEEMHGQVIHKVLESIIHRKWPRHVEFIWRDRW
jgi:hypothetical protein